MVRNDSMSAINFDKMEFKEFIHWFQISYCDSITEISKPNKKADPFVEDDFNLIGLDDIAEKLSTKLVNNRDKCNKDCFRYLLDEDKFRGCNCKQLLYSSTDGLYVHFSEDSNFLSFYFIEFKKKDLTEKNIGPGSEKRLIDFLKKDIEMIINNKDRINSVDELKNILNFFKSTAEGRPFHLDYLKVLTDSSTCFSTKLSQDLKLKGYESLISLMPHMYIEFCKSTGKNFSKEDLISFNNFILNCEKNYILVHLQNKKNKSNRYPEHKSKRDKVVGCSNNLFQLQRLRDFPYNQIKIFNQPGVFLGYIKNEAKNFDSCI